MIRADQASRCARVRHAPDYPCPSAMFASEAPAPPSPVRPEEPGSRSKTEALYLEGSREGGSRRPASTFGLARPSSPRTYELRQAMSINDLSGPAQVRLRDMGNQGHT